MACTRRDYCANIITEQAQMKHLDYKRLEEKNNDIILKIFDDLTALYEGRRSECQNVLKSLSI